MNLLVAKKVDLYLQAHDHAYARSYPLALKGSCTAIPVSSFNPDCVVDTNPTGQFAAGTGTILATVGSSPAPVPRTIGPGATASPATPARPPPSTPSC